MTDPRVEELWSARAWIVKADLDKPHRCPSCWTGAAVWDSPRRRMGWHAYTCPRCGQCYGQGFWRRTREGWRRPAGWLRDIWWWRKVRFWTHSLPDAIRHGELRHLLRVHWMQWKWGDHSFCAQRGCWRLQKPHSILCRRHSDRR